MGLTWCVTTLTAACHISALITEGLTPLWSLSSDGTESSDGAENSSGDRFYVTRGHVRTVDIARQ
jgi:hypothetical protein